MAFSEVHDETYDLATETKLLALLNELDHFSRQRIFPAGLNIFEAAGLVTQEIRHSNFLSFLLRPQEPHGLGDVFLRRFLRKAVEKMTVESNLRPLSIVLSDFSDALVSREWRSMDFVIESRSNNLVFVIENKIESSESENQLVGYRTIIEGEFSQANRVFVYLTAEGEPPSDETWAALSYADVIDTLEEAREEIGSLSENTNLVLDHYIALVRRHIVPDQNLIDHCRKIYASHREALELIIRYGEVNAFASAAGRFFDSHPELKVFTVRPGAAVFLPNEIYEVVPQFEGVNWWGQSRPLIFWFNLPSANQASNRFGIVVEVGPLSDQDFDRTKLAQTFLDYFKGKSKIYPKYTRVFSKYTRLSDDQVSNPDEILNAMNSLYAAVVDHLPSIKKIASDFFKKL